MGQQEIYQIFTGRSPHGLNAPSGVAPFTQLSKAPWNRLTDVDLKIIYLLGIGDNRGPIVENGRVISNPEPGRVPSIFALRDQGGLHPDLGTEVSFRELCASIRSHGARVIMDYVPGHSAVNHPWIQEHREYYQKSDKHESGLRHEYSGDVVMFDYTNPDLCRAQVEVVCRIALLGVDGIRADMAHLVPCSFWKVALARAREINPNFLAVAEGYGKGWKPLENLIDAGFDGVYDVDLYHEATQVGRGEKKASDFVGLLNHRLHYEYSHKLVHFLANHDDPLTPEVALIQPALMTIVSLLPGFTLISNGQLNGFARKLDLHSAMPLPPEVSELNSVPQWYQELASVKRAVQPVLQNISYEHNLIVGEGATKAGRFKLFANIGPHQVAYPVPRGRPLLGNGWQILASGQAELFEIE